MEQHRPEFLLAIGKSINFEHALNYPLLPIPLSQTNIDITKGNINKTNKSTFQKIVLKHKVPQNNIDLMVGIRLLKKKIRNI